MTQPLDFKSNIGLVHIISRRCYGWVMSLGVAMDYDDVFQEVSLAFISAAEGYDPESGNKFSAYLTRAAYNQIRKTLGILTGAKRLNEKEKQALAELQEENKQLAAAGKEQKSTFMGLAVCSIEDMKDEDGASPIDMFVAHGKDPEQVASETQEWEYELSRLSPLANLLAEMIKEPPAELLAELESQFEWSKIAALKQSGKITKPYVTLRAVVEFVALISDQRREDLTIAEAELLQAAARI